VVVRRETGTVVTIAVAGWRLLAHFGVTDMERAASAQALLTLPRGTMSLACSWSINPARRD
jgi:hypothetical protein